MTTQVTPTPAHAAVLSTPPPPRWAVWAAHAVPLIALPSTLWRLAMTVGVPVGYGEEVLRTDYGLPGSGYLILPLISLVQEGVALLTLGLVRDWGLVAPRWLPVIGGKPVRTWAAAGVALVGALAMTAITLSQLLVWDTVDQGNLTGVHRSIMGWLYAPLLLWGPLLAAVAVSYLRRRRQS
ncbi:hypothetical protein ACFWBH_07825 [Streptomyces sp. NPDC059999]|uniref:hypothetical protein n=1 Tax=unclassified Streptomyces TaxID=2593676 RepID=UPI00226FD734|nr:MULTISPECIES: hypothetical protein [unclassified Streptomyces]MCY0920165.1 hypothetical protein [Streptomyces sp. H27-G5]